METNCQLLHRAAKENPDCQTTLGAWADSLAEDEDSGMEEGVRTLMDIQRALAERKGDHWKDILTETRDRLRWELELTASKIQVGDVLVYTLGGGVAKYRTVGSPIGVALQQPENGTVRVRLLGGGDVQALCRVVE